MIELGLWCLQAAKDILRADDETVSALLAGLILGTGVIGTLGGGMCQKISVDLLATVTPACIELSCLFSCHQQLGLGFFQAFCLLLSDDSHTLPPARTLIVHAF